MATNSENLEKYKRTLTQDRLKGAILVPPGLSLEDEIKFLLAGPDLTGTEFPSKSPTKDIALGKKDANPYIRARAELLSKMAKSKRIEIEQMEVSGKTDNRIYSEFAKAIANLGDQFSEKSA